LHFDRKRAIRAVEADLDNELRFHFDQQVEKHRCAGHGREEAARLARLAFGGMDQVKEECAAASLSWGAQPILSDDEHSPGVAVIDDAFARQVFGGRDPLHQRLNLDGIPAPVEIVGVVGHVNQWGLDADEHHSPRAQLTSPTCRCRTAPWR
jgi:hypothetical protein